ETGGFPSLRINEDMEFGMALSKRCRIMWNKDNGVSHYFDNSMRHYFFEQILWAESVVKLYLSDPGTVGKKNTYAKSEIFIHLFLTSLLYLCLFGIIFKPPAALMFFCIVAAVYAIINIQFIRFAAKSEGYLFSFKLMPFLLLRNTTWILGVIKAIFKHSLLVLRQLNLFGKKGKRQ
ncbi:MAG: hypothetical protein Q8O12_02230, partial [Candidatus Omnitrophota bacterium]|nr:hypothetical protein [Candidatus Omnitrophota bacterium]